MARQCKFGVTKLSLSTGQGFDNREVRVRRNVIPGGTLQDLAAAAATGSKLRVHFRCVYPQLYLWLEFYEKCVCFVTRVRFRLPGDATSHAGEVYATSLWAAPSAKLHWQHARGKVRGLSYAARLWSTQPAAAGYTYTSYIGLSGGVDSSGKDQHGRPHGKGLSVDENGDRYEGDWVHGEKTGHGVEVSYNDPNQKVSRQDTKAGIYDNKEMFYSKFTGKHTCAHGTFFSSTICFEILAWPRWAITCANLIFYSL